MIWRNSHECHRVTGLVLVGIKHQAHFLMSLQLSKRCELKKKTFAYLKTNFVYADILSKYFWEDERLRRISEFCNYRIFSMRKQWSYFRHVSVYMHKALFLYLIRRKVVVKDFSAYPMKHIAFYPKWLRCRKCGDFAIKERGWLGVKLESIEKGSKVAGNRLALQDIYSWDLPTAMIKLIYFSINL